MGFTNNLQRQFGEDGFVLLQALKKTGLQPSDPRLKECMEKLRRAVKDSVGEVMMDKDLFRR